MMRRLEPSNWLSNSIQRRSPVAELAGGALGIAQLATWISTVWGAVTISVRFLISLPPEPFSTVDQLPLVILYSIRVPISNCELAWYNPSDSRCNSKTSGCHGPKHSWFPAMYSLASAGVSLGTWTFQTIFAFCDSGAGICCAQALMQNMDHAIAQIPKRQTCRKSRRLVNHKLLSSILKRIFHLAWIIACKRLHRSRHHRFLAIASFETQGSISSENLAASTA